MTTSIIEKWMGEGPDDLGPREQVAFFDYDPEIDDGGIWLATLPLTEIYAHGATECRITFDLFVARRWGAVLGGIAGAILLAILSYVMPPPIGGPNGAALGMFLGGGGGAMLGWMFGHRFAPQPISLYRRVWAPCADDEVCYWELMLSEGKDEPICLPSGELLRETARGISKLEVFPLQYTNIRGEEALDKAVAVEGAITLVGTEDQDADEEPFDPAMIRATTMWEVMQQRIDKMLWGRHQVTAWDKVQVGGAVVLAVVVVGIAAFLILTTTAPPPAAMLWSI